MIKNHNTSKTNYFLCFKSRCLTGLLCALTVLTMTGCSKNEAPEKLEDIDFTVVSGTDIPGDLQELINTRQENSFELTYSDGSCLYIAKGYGTQETGGYSIVVNDFYRSDDSLVFDTELFGPKKDDEFSKTPSTPYIVIKTEFREEPVVFP